MRFPKVSAKSFRAFAIEIRNEMSGGTATDDSRFSIRHIESEIKHVYGEVQKQIDFTNELFGIKPDQQRATVYPCIDLVDSTDFYCKCTKTGGKFKKAKLPQFYEWKGQPFIDYLGGTNLELPFVPMGGISELNAFGNNVNRPSYFLSGKNAYVYLPLDYNLMCQITVSGIPADPTETSGLCYDVWNENWAVPEYVKAAVKDRVRSSFANIMITTSNQADIRNNAQHGNQNTSILAP